jgi:hypothetical protein
VEILAEYEGPLKKLTQKDKVRGALFMGPKCGTDFLRMMIPRYAARILELRQEGWEITTRPCKMHHHDSPQVVYEMVESKQERLFA